jgi:hypothetical protein
LILIVDSSDSSDCISDSFEFNINLRSDVSWSNLLTVTNDLFEFKSLSSFMRINS